MSWGFTAYVRSKERAIALVNDQRARTDQFPQAAANALKLQIDLLPAFGADRILKIESHGHTYDAGGKAASTVELIAITE